MLFSQLKKINATNPKSLFHIQKDEQHCQAIIMMHPKHLQTEMKISYIPNER